LEVGDLPLDPWVYYEKSRSKTGEMWRSATTPDISFELRNYLKIRETQPKAALTKTLFIGREGSLDNQAISTLMFLLIKKSGLNTQNGFKPTALRDAFEDALVQANVNHKVKESLMGHSGSIENEYGGHRNLMVNTIEALKKTYPFLTLNGHGQESLGVKAEFELRIVKLDETIALLASEQKRRFEESILQRDEVALLKRKVDVFEAMKARMAEIETALASGKLLVSRNTAKEIDGWKAEVDEYLKEKEQKQNKD
jgi:hypothetical protein